MLHGSYEKAVYGHSGRTVLGDPHSEAVRVLQLLVMATDFRDSNSQMESSVSIMNYSGTVT